jgi:hypothetical protein
LGLVEVKGKGTVETWRLVGPRSRTSKTQREQPPTLESTRREERR